MNHKTMIYSNKKCKQNVLKVGEVMSTCCGKITYSQIHKRNTYGKQVPYATISKRLKTTL